MTERTAQNGRPKTPSGRSGSRLTFADSSRDRSEGPSSARRLISE
jgi:hypothetical protein